MGRDSFAAATPRAGRGVAVRVPAPLTVKSTAELCSQLRDAEPSPIEVLDLSQAGITLPRLKSVMKALEHNSKLRELDLSGCELRPLDLPHIMRRLALDRGVARCLHTLLLDGCNLRDDALSGIAILTQQHSKLHSVSLRLNAMGDRSAEALAVGLERNRTLTSLELSSNKISSSGAESLLKIFFGNTTLTNLSLHSNRAISAAVLTSIATRLARNIGIGRSLPRRVRPKMVLKGFKRLPQSPG